MPLQYVNPEQFHQRQAVYHPTRLQAPCYTDERELNNEVVSLHNLQGLAFRVLQAMPQASGTIIKDSTETPLQSIITKSCA